MCSSDTRPMPNDIWQEAVLFACVPGNIGDLGYFRKRVFAALEKNKRTQEKENRSHPRSEVPSLIPEEVQDWIIGLVTLLDLQNNLDFPDARQPINQAQEYFLFQCLFRRIKNILKSQKILNIIDNNIVDNNVLAEALCLSPSLSNRYMEIRKAAGLKTPKIITSLNWAIKVAKTPSTLPNVLLKTKNADKSLVPNGSIIQNLPHYIREFASLRIDKKQLMELANKMYGRRELRFSLNDFSEEHMIIGFGMYYALARGDLQHSRADLKKGGTLSKERQEILRKELKEKLALHKGMLGSLGQLLSCYLESIMANPGIYPSTESLLQSHKRTQNPADPDRERQWESFFKKINECVSSQYLNTQVIDPAAKNTAAAINSFIFSQITLGAMMPIPNGLNRTLKYFLSSAQKSFNTNVSRCIHFIAQPILDRMPGPGQIVSSLFEHPLHWSGGAAIGGTVVAGGALMTGVGSYMLASALPDLASALPASFSPVGNPIMSAAALGVGFSFKAVWNGIAKGVVTLEDFMPFSKITTPALTLANKAINAHKPPTDPVPEMKKAEKENIEFEEPDYSQLDAEDKAVDERLESIFHLAFADLPQRRRRNAKRHSALRVQPRDKDNSTKFRVKDRNALHLIHREIKDFRNLLHIQVEKETQTLLDIFNTSDAVQNVKPVDYLTIVKNLEKRTLGAIGNTVGITDSDAPQIALAIARIDIKKGRLSQVETIIKMVEELAETSQNTPSYLSKWEQLGMELKRKSAIDLKSNSRRFNRQKLRFQAGANTMLREEPIKDRQKGIARRGNLVEEMRETGKTWHAIPSFAAHCEKVPILVFPKSSASDNRNQVRMQLKKIYNRDTHALHFKRSMNLKPKNLEALLILLQNAIKEREAIQLANEDIQSLRLVFFEQSMRWNHSDFDIDRAKQKESLILLKKILRIFAEQTKSLPDGTLQSKLNFPIGPPKIIPREYCNIIQLCMREICNDAELMPYIKENKLTSLDADYYSKVIKPRLAEKISCYAGFRIQEIERREECFEFLCDAISVPLWIASDKKLYREMAMVKGCLGVLFEGYLKNPLHFSNDGGPNPFETLVKTYLTILSEGLSKKDYAQLAAYVKEKRKVNQNRDDYKKFGDDINDYEKMRFNTDALFLYVRFFEWKKIQYFTRNISDNSIDFSDIFKYDDNDFTTWMGLMKEFEPLIVKKFEDDPVILFGFKKEQKKQQNQILLQQDDPRQMQFGSTQFSEWPWPEIKDPAMLDWLKFSSPVQPKNIGFFNWFKRNPSTEICPFFKARDLLEHASSAALKNIANAFDARLWMPNNFIPRWVRRQNEIPGEIGSKRQFKLTEALIHIIQKEDGYRIIDMGPLSLRDAAMWKEKLTCDDSYWSQHKVKTVLWDIASQSVQAGFQLDQRKLRFNPDFQKLICQLKFLDGDGFLGNLQESASAWIENNDPLLLKEAFDVIQAQRGRDAKTGISEMDNLLLELAGIHFEE